MHLLYLGWTHLPLASWSLICLTPSSPLGHFQPAPLTTIPIHFFFHQLRCKIVCIHLQCSLIYYLSTLFPVSTICLQYFLCSIISASSLPLSVIVPIFKVPTLMSERLPFHTSCCFFTRLSPLFLLLFSLCLFMLQ